MSALRRSEDLLSLKTRRIVIQNEDSSYPPAGAILAMDSKGRGGTVITQDVSLNSVALMGQTTAGILTYSDASGLLLNSEPIGSSPTLTNLVVTGTSMLGISAEVMGPLTANSVNALVSLTTPMAYITNLDVSNATIANLDVTAVSINSLDISNATITNGSITNLDVSNATIANLDLSSASINSLDISNATIDILTARNGAITNLDVSNATIANLYLSSASVSSLDASNANIDILDVSAASVNSLDASNGVITFLDVSSATFKRLDASAALINTLTSTNATVSAGLNARYALIGDNTNTSDPTANFVFIQGVSGESVGRVRGPNRSDGTLALGARANLTNITLNADGTTDISNAHITSLDASSASVSGGFNAGYAYVGDKFQPDPSQNFVFINAVAGQTVANVRGSNLSTGTLQLGANVNSLSNITLNADASTTITKLSVGSTLQLLNGTFRSYITDPGVAYPTLPWFFFTPTTTVGTEISRIGVTSVNNTPVTYSFTINSYCTLYSLIQVNISFDAYLAQNGYTSATFSIRSNTMDAGARRPKSLFVTSVYTETGLRITNPYTISFFLTKNADYNNDTTYFSFHYENMLNTSVELYFGNATGSFFWEVIGLV